MKVFRLLCLTLSLAWACADVPQASDDSLTVRKAALSSRTGWIELRSYTYGSGGDIRLNTNKVFLKTGYLFRRFEGFVFDPLTTPPADTVPLNAWCSNTIGDCFIVTNPSTQQRPGEVPAGYSFTRREGWIYASTHPYTPGLRALNGWRNVNSAERFETTDPEWSSAHSLDHPGWSFLGTLGYMMVPDNQPIDKFHYSEMRSGSAGPLGRRRLLAFVPIYSDEPNDRRSPSAIQDGLFGPSVPNVLGQTQSVSNGWFSWFNSGVVTFAPIDDPDTAVDESG